MKKLVLIIACVLTYLAIHAQTPARDSMNRQRQTDPTILNPAPTTPQTYPAVPRQRVDTPVYRQRSDTTIYRRTEPRDDRDPSRIPRMDRDSIRK